MNKKQSLSSTQLLNLKLGVAIAESILAIPFLGYMILKASFFLVAVILFAAHIYLYLKLKGTFKNAGRGGHIIGAIATIFGFFPAIGWAVHAVAAVVIWVEYTKLADEQDKKTNKTKINNKESIAKKTLNNAESLSKKIEKATDKISDKFDNLTSKPENNKSTKNNNLNNKDNLSIKKNKESKEKLSSKDNKKDSENK